MHEAGSSGVRLIQFINSESPCHRVRQKSFQQNDPVRLRSATSDIVSMIQSVIPFPFLHNVVFNCACVPRACVHMQA